MITIHTDFGKVHLNTRYLFCQSLYEEWKRPHVAPPASRWGTKLPKQLWPYPCDLDLWPLTLTYDLYIWPWWPWPWPLRSWPWTIFSETRLKTMIFDLWPWSSNLFKIQWTLMHVPNFRSVFQPVQSAERKQIHTQTHTETHTQTDATESITSSANAGSHKVMSRLTKNIKLSKTLSLPFWQSTPPIPFALASVYRLNSLSDEEYQIIIRTLSPLLLAEYTPDTCFAGICI